MTMNPRLSESAPEVTNTPDAKPSLKSGHTSYDPNAPLAMTVTTTNFSGLSTRASSDTGEESDWCERFDRGSSCESYLRRIVLDCLSGMVNMPPTGNWSWKIPRRKDVSEGEG